jgi:hypothetical protein
LRKLVLLSISLGLFIVSYSQVKYGIKAGLTQSFVKETPSILDADNTLKTGFQFGFFLDKKILDNLFIRSSLQLTQKGYQTVLGNPGGPFYWSRNLSTTYLELPLDVLHGFRLSKTSVLYIGTGPVFSYGLQGTLKATLVSLDNNQQLHTQISTDNKIFKTDKDRRLDFGWDFLICIQSCRALFAVSYNHGISDVTKGDNQSLKNKSFALAVGYLLK